MEYKCLKIDDYSGKKLFEEDVFEFNNLCYVYPLIIFVEDSLIYFYGEAIKLDPKEINLLSVLVEHNTKKLETNKPRGISPKTLCKRINYSPRNEKNNFCYDNRLTKHKCDIFDKIKKAFKLQNGNYKNVIEHDNGKELFIGQIVEPASPYYRFQFETALKHLLYSENTKSNKKYYTDFSFVHESNKL